MQKLTRRLMCFGTYSIICHLCGILLFFNIQSSYMPPALLIWRCAEMLEYSLMSLLILCVGGLALDSLRFH